MEENFFADIPHEGQTPEEVFGDNVDKELQVETPAESQAEKEDLKQNEAWKKIREERDAERRAREELEERLQALEAEKSIESKPEFLTDLIGEDEEITQKYLKYEQGLKEKIKQEIIQDQLKAQQKEQEETEKWNRWTQEQIETVGKENNIDFTKDENLKNELSKIMLDYTPTDNEGNLDYRKGMKLLLDLKKSQEAEKSLKSEARKTVADATVSKETSAKETKSYLTSADLRGGWRNLL